MNIKTTIAALAISASSAFALVGPGTETRTICLAVDTDANGLQYASNCDESRNNGILNLPILANGCAEKQVSVIATGHGGKFHPEISSCMPPNVVQL